MLIQYRCSLYYHIIPQGHDLFNVYTADILKISNAIMATHAGYTAIFSSGNDSVETVHFLKTHLNLIDEWSSNWRI